MKAVLLGVNVDHVATLREVRRINYPSPVKAAVLAEMGGADSIVVHLREDRRHIKERDLFLLKEILEIPLNLEMSINEDIVKIACKVKPFQATLVPERRQELTTEGGLNVVKNFKRIKEVVEILKSKKIRVSLFIDPEKSQILKAKDTGADAVEIHTGRYAEASTQKRKEAELKKIRESALFSKKIGLHTFAGHGLNYVNVKPVACIPEIEELNIGHSIIARSVFVGMVEAVREMKHLLNESRY